MREGFRIGRLSGIDIKVDTSWLFILALVVWSLSSLFGAWHPDWALATSVMVAFAAALAFFASVLFHEMAHSIVAKAYGIPVRDITLHLFGGVSNIEREPPTPGAEFLMTIVGPLASIGLGIGLVVVGAVTTGVLSPRATTPVQALADLGPISTVVMWLGPINVLVGLFNLVPGFPLDGGRILRAILWKATGNLSKATRWAANVGQAVGWGFLAMGIFMAFGYRVPFFGTGLMGGLWIAMIGLFLRNAAVQHLRAATLQDALAGLRVADLMQRQVVWVSSGAPVRALVEQGLLVHRDRAFPVHDGSKLVGLVSAADVRRVPPNTWESLAVGDVMTPRARFVSATPDEPVVEALRRLGTANVAQTPVMDGDTLLGILFESDVARWLDMRSAPPASVRHRHA